MHDWSSGCSSDWISWCRQNIYTTTPTRAKFCEHASILLWQNSLPHLVHVWMVSLLLCFSEHYRLASSKREEEDVSRECGAIIAIGEIVGQLSRWQFYSPCADCAKAILPSTERRSGREGKGRERDPRARFRYFPSTISWEFTVKSGPRGRSAWR